ncbi:MAG TPA: MCE family protein [Nocardioidaceae bacterium]|nr:MCE family protein [Nocardioidaceae bacterium]
MRRYTEQQVVRIGVIAVIVAVLLMAAALNLQKFPGFRGVSYEAAISDASGLHKGNMVQVAGIRVGRVGSIDLAGDHVIVHFSVDPDVRFGDETTASVEVLNLLGEKYLELTPAGAGDTEGGARIPIERTSASYDIVKVFTELTDTTERIDIPQLQEALTTVAGTMNRTSDEARTAFDGLARLSESIASRDAELQSLLKHANSVSRLLAERKGDIVNLAKQGDLILQELSKRKEAIHTLLLNTGVLADQLGGLVDDNQAQLKPMLQQLADVNHLLLSREKALRASIHNLGPYVSILSNIIGTGPWFDAYAVNLLHLASGEFVPAAG